MSSTQMNLQTFAKDYVTDPTNQCIVKSSLPNASSSAIAKYFECFLGQVMPPTSPPMPFAGPQKLQSEEENYNPTNGHDIQSILIQWEKNFDQLSNEIDLD